MLLQILAAVDFRYVLDAAKNRFNTNAVELLAVPGTAPAVGEPATTLSEAAGEGEGTELDPSGPLAAELAAIDAIIARSKQR